MSRYSARANLILRKSGRQIAFTASLSEYGGKDVAGTPSTRLCQTFSVAPVRQMKVLYLGRGLILVLTGNCIMLRLSDRNPRKIILQCVAES